MTYRITRFMALAVALVAIGGSRFEAADTGAEPTYRVRTLPSLGGTNTRGNGVNTWGLVSGFSQVEDDAARHATIWLGGHAFDLRTLGGLHSSVGWSGLSETGLVVGIAQTSALQTRKDGWSCRGFFPGADRAKYLCVGFVWEWGRMRALPTLGGDNGFAASANNRRQVVGWAEGPNADPSCVNPTDREFKAVLWDLNDNRTVMLRPLGTDKASSATAISDRGHAVGISGDCDQSIGRHSAHHAVLWTSDTATDLGTISGDTWNTPTAITPRGDIIVGFVNAAGVDPTDPKFRAWLWTTRDDIQCPRLPGTRLCDLGTLDDGGTAEAWGVNSRGQVVGTACSPAGTCRAFLWEDGEMTDLNAFKGSYSHHLENAMDISDRGQIVGRARTASGFEGFAAVPR